MRLPQITELARQTLELLKKRRLKPTPENYSQVFDELGERHGLIFGDRARMEKYKRLLLINYQNELEAKPARNLDEFLSFVVSRLNAQSGRAFEEFFDFFKSVMEALLSSRDRRIREAASATLDRLSKTMDAEAIFALEKKWKDLAKDYEAAKNDPSLVKFGVLSEDDFDGVIFKLLRELDSRSFEGFAGLLASCLAPSLVEDLRLRAFEERILARPFMLGERGFKNELRECVARRVRVDKNYVEKNLALLNESYEKISKFINHMSTQSEENVGFLASLRPDEGGRVSVDFETLRNKFFSLDAKLKNLQTQLDLARHGPGSELSLTEELEWLDKNYEKYGVNYALAVFSVENYRFIMERYGLGSLNEIFVRFKRILREHTAGELWMLDEKAYLVLSPGKNREQMARWVGASLEQIEHFRFIYRQEVIRPRVRAIFLDRDSCPGTNIFEQLLEQMNA